MPRDEYVERKAKLTMWRSHMENRGHPDPKCDSWGPGHRNQAEPCQTALAAQVTKLVPHGAETKSPHKTLSSLQYPERVIKRCYFKLLNFRHVLQQKKIESWRFLVNLNHTEWKEDMHSKCLQRIRSVGWPWVVMSGIKLDPSLQPRWKSILNGICTLL